MHINLPSYNLLSDFGVLQVSKFGYGGSQLMFVLGGRAERGRQFGGLKFGGAY